MSNPFYIYYNSLPLVQKQIYSELLPEVDKATKNITIRTKCTSQDAFTAISAIMNDHPEIFWMTGKSQAWTLNDAVSSVQIEYNALADRLNYHKMELQKVVDSYMKLVKGKNVLEQERLIHDKMVKDINYVHGRFDQTSYSSLVLNRSVCAGYSRGFQYLMQQIGIPCYFCKGKAKGSLAKSWGPHSWNILKLGSDYYGMDITWDDCYGTTTGNISYTYYNCNDARMSSDHILDKACSCLPQCNGQRYSFEKIFGRSPELEVILQDGITCRTVINSKSVFLHHFIPEIWKGTTGTIRMSFPSQKGSVYNTIDKWVEEAIRSKNGKTIGWRLQKRCTDYRNGWYRIEISLIIQQ